MVEYNKLVRDNIPDIMLKNGEKPITRILADSEYITCLEGKLREEVEVYLESRAAIELADIL